MIFSAVAHRFEKTWTTFLIASSDKFTNFATEAFATPFDGWTVSAAVAMTLRGGEIVYHDLHTQEETL